MKQLTLRQRRVLDMIEAYQQDNGYPPTRVEIAKHFGFKSSNAAEEYIKALVKKGFIDRIQGQSRGIRLKNKAEDGLPIINDVLTQSTLLDKANIHKRLSIQGSTFSPSADFFLEINNDCLNELEIPGLNNGDLLAIHKTQAAANGEVILARIGNQLRLQKMNQEDLALQQISTKAVSSPIIEGKPVGVIRRSF